MEVNNQLNFTNLQQPGLRTTTQDPRLAQEQSRASARAAAVRFPETTPAQDIPSDETIEARLDSAFAAKRERGALARGSVVDILA